MSESNETKYSEKIIREAMSEQSGHATLFRASDKDRESFDVFNPQPNALMNITRKIKKNFDVKKRHVLEISSIVPNFFIGT